VRAARPPSLKRVACLGLACGVLAAVQIYFAASIAGTALAVGVALRLRRARWLTVVVRSVVVMEAAIAGFALATAPTEGHVIRFFNFLWRADRANLGLAGPACKVHTNEDDGRGETEYRQLRSRHPPRTQSRGLRSHRRRLSGVERSAVSPSEPPNAHLATARPWHARLRLHRLLTCRLHAEEPSDSIATEHAR
jgi:hypothetical protein